ncbi:mevalonate kinase, partial [candidate division KSB1 bacterium]
PYIILTKKKRNTFYAKILLFGEYSVICDSMGLTIPYTHFKGEFSFINEDKYTDFDFAVKSNELIKAYLPFIMDLKKSGQLLCDFDINKFEQELDKGLYFESTIPQGYGLGSSGAIIAALYDRYVNNKIPNNRNLNHEKMLQLKEIFSQLEAYYHGTSSGLDPLNSYISFPLHIKTKSEIETVGIPRNKENKMGAIFLINTGHSGKTEPLVNLFLDKCKDPSYLKKIKEEMIPLNNYSISTLIKGEIKDFFNILTKLSRFQLENLQPMIPQAFRMIWKRGLESGEYMLKLCGSGGGGFLLGFTNDYEKVKKKLLKEKIELIPVYKNSQ